MIVDTHCHIHSSDYKLDPSVALDNARKSGVEKIICVGTDIEDSRRALEFVQNKESCWASVGLHPHDAKLGDDAIAKLEDIAKTASKKLVAIGECGLDYYYNHSNKDDQRHAFETQIKLALALDLPMIFHVREAFDDFIDITNKESIRGVVHSFTANKKELDRVLNSGFYVGINGIMTFTKDQTQLDALKAIPLNRMLIETDAPFLTPSPYRGKINEPVFARTVLEFVANLRGESISEVEKMTSANANELFGI